MFSQNILPSILPTTESVLLIKIALTNDQCGALIGKGGGVITTLQRSCGVLIKAGSVDELFPGTPFRPAIIRGTIDGIHACLTELVKILHRDHLLRTETEATPPVASLLAPPPFPPVIRHQDFAVRLLIPDSAAGAIIGKQGNVIRALCDNSGASIRLSAPDQQRDNSIFERVVAVSGTGPSVVSAVVSIFLTLASDSRHLMYANPTVIYPRLPPDGFVSDNNISNNGNSNSNNNFNHMLNHPHGAMGNTGNFPGYANLIPTTNPNTNPYFLSPHASNSSNLGGINGNNTLTTNININYEPTLNPNTFHTQSGLSSADNTNSNGNEVTMKGSYQSGTYSDPSDLSTPVVMNTHSWYSSNTMTTHNPSSVNNPIPLPNPSPPNYNNHLRSNGELSSFVSLSSMSSLSTGNKTFSNDSLSSFGSGKNTPFSVADNNSSTVTNESEAAMLAARHALANHRGYGNVSMFTTANLSLPPQPPLPTNTPPPLPTSVYPYSMNNNNTHNSTGNFKPSPPLPPSTGPEYHPAYASILLSSPIDNLLRGHRENQNGHSSNNPNTNNSLRTINNTLLSSSPSNHPTVPSPSRNNHTVNPPVPSNSSMNNMVDYRTSPGNNEHYRTTNNGPSNNSNQRPHTNESSSTLSAIGVTSTNTGLRLLPPVADLGTIHSNATTANTSSTGSYPNHGTNHANKFTNENFHNNIIPEHLQNQLSSLNL